VGLELRALVIMPGHLATTPRMVKVADSLAAAGHDVRVVSAGFTAWARQADVRLASTRPWSWTAVEHSREQAPFVYAKTGARRHLARTMARMHGAPLPSWWATTRALSRAHRELVSRGLQQPCDFVYGGSLGGIAVAAEIAERRSVPFAVDLEDLHTAESIAPDAALQHALARRVLERVIPGAAFVTTSSECIAEGYEKQFGRRPAVLHNVFPLPSQAPALAAHGGPLRLYWFSQTIATARGIEDMVDAVFAAGIRAEITLRGRQNVDALAQIDRRIHEHLARGARSAAGLTLHVEQPADPDRMIELAAAHDVGFASEHEPVENRQLCLTNKVFTYLAAGVAIAMGETRAQRHLAAELGEAAFLYRPGEIQPLAAWLRQLGSDRSSLRRAREAAWQQAVRRWNWHHTSEEGQLLSLVTQAVA
jgi:hypothetical protein